VVLVPHARGHEPFDKRFFHLFNSYYESLGPRHPRPQRGLLTRPSSDEVLAYRAHVDAAMAAFIESADEAAWRVAAHLVELGLHHEQQHQELILTDLKHLFWHNPLLPAYRDAPPATSGVAADGLRWQRFPAGLQAIGNDDGGFAFDNEKPRHPVYVNAFEVASRCVTNGEYLDFIEDGGYARAALWLSDGWDMVGAQGLREPLYWRRCDDGWRTFTLRGMQPLDPGQPVCHLSYYEADAYARWSGARLPTEAEWEVAAAQEAVRGNFIESGVLHPAAAGGGAPAQFYGDVWEWTQSAYLPYPGFTVAPGAVGEYNGKFMCNQFVLRGGSCVTPRSHMRVSYRNFFPPAARWQFSGLRLARDAA
jgi:ergothioneine biosynthesis protein EgtB